MNEMNRTQKEILYNWGDADYEATIERLDKVRQLTVDQRFRAQIVITICRLLMMENPSVYTSFFNSLRRSMELSKAKERLRKKNRVHRGFCWEKAKQKRARDHR